MGNLGLTILSYSQMSSLQVVFHLTSHDLLTNPQQILLVYISGLMHGID
jgi:hypothetical protein